MTLLKSVFAFTLALVLGLSLGLVIPAMTEPDTNYTNLSQDYVQDLNIDPAFDPQEYADAYDSLAIVGQPEGINAQHIRFMGYTDHQFTTDLLFTIQDPATESYLVFISLADSTPALKLTDLNGDEADLLRANIYECESDLAQINPCIRGNAIFF